MKNFNFRFTPIFIQLEVIRIATETTLWINNISENFIQIEINLVSFIYLD